MPPNLILARTTGVISNIAWVDIRLFAAFPIPNLPVLVVNTGPDCKHPTLIMAAGN